MTRRLRRVAARLAILGLLLQVGLGAAHSARHFDHLVGHLLPTAALGVAQLSNHPRGPSPAAPAAPDIEHCAIDLGLAASGSFVLPNAGDVPLPPVYEAARLDIEPRTTRAASRRHFLPPARAPPVVAISL
jgi:hypothetical protein